MDEKMQAEMILALAMGGEDPSTAATTVTELDQRQSLYRDELPVDGSPFKMRCARTDEEKAAQRAAWEATGIKFDKHEPRNLFVPASLPVGWSRVSTDHPMWTDLVDGRGRKRASIFYKSAFWDREAFIDLLPRFSIHQVHSGDRDNRPIQFEIRDCEKAVYQTRIENAGRRPGGDASAEERAAYWEREEVLTRNSRRECEDWLQANYPDWKNAAAYWD